jgi:hypothetical protein
MYRHRVVDWPVVGWPALGTPFDPGPPDTRIMRKWRVACDLYWNSLPSVNVAVRDDTGGLVDSSDTVNLKVNHSNNNNNNNKKKKNNNNNNKKKKEDGVEIQIERVL